MSSTSSADAIPGVPRSTGWVVGFLLGLLFAVLSYLYYWVAVILLGGALGYQLTIGVLQWIGFDD